VLDTDAIPNVPIRSLALHPYQPETIYAAPQSAFFCSRDGDDSWEPFDDGMPRIITTQLVLRRSSLTLLREHMGREFIDARCEVIDGARVPCLPDSA
jgi:hypothetical protein